MRAALNAIPLLALTFAVPLPPDVQIDIGLSGAIERADDLGSLLDHLERHLVWRVGMADAGPTDATEVHVSVLRIDRGRVTASRQSALVAASRDRTRLAEALGAGELRNLLACCLRAEDPPVAVRALSGQAYLDGPAFERAVAGMASRAIADGMFDVDPRVRLDWGRQFVIVISATAPDGVRTRPLLLVFDRL